MVTRGLSQFFSCFPAEANLGVSSVASTAGRETVHVMVRRLSWFSAHPEEPGLVELLLAV